MSNKKTYWKGIEELKNDPGFIKHADKEFVDLGVEQDPGHSRRDFLKMMGFGVSAVTLAACEAPIRKAIPYIQKPVDVDPGIPNYYASTYINGGDYCSIVVKTREGRPIKIDGNSLSGVTKGGTSAQVARRQYRRTSKHQCSAGHRRFCGTVRLEGGRRGCRLRPHLHGVLQQRDNLEPPPRATMLETCVCCPTGGSAHMNS